MSDLVPAAFPQLALKHLQQIKSAEKAVYCSRCALTKTSMNKRADSQSSIAATLSALVSRPSTTCHFFTFGGGPVLNLENMAELGVVRVSHSHLILAGGTTLIVTARSGNFRCENISMVCTNHENINKNTKYILQRIIIIARTFFSHNFKHS